jgi:branched-subunit amino acid aminotransferase/4-amino-4-deoxychorismate lyase
VRGVTPVVVIGGQPVGDGRPGPITARLVDLNERVLEHNTSDW